MEQILRSGVSLRFLLLDLDLLDRLPLLLLLLQLLLLRLLDLDLLLRPLPLLLSRLRDLLRLGLRRAYMASSSSGMIRA